MNMKLSTRLCGCLLIVLSVLLIFVDRDITASVFLFLLGAGCLIIPGKYIK